MIHLLYAVIFVQMSLLLLLLFKTPLRELIILTFDTIKRGRGYVVVKTTCSIVFLVLMSRLLCLLCIHLLSEDGAVSNPTFKFQLLGPKHLLEASLLGLVLLLTLMIDRLNHYIRKLRLVRKLADRFLVECGRLLEDNQNLRKQLEGKKSM